MPEEKQDQTQAVTTPEELVALYDQLGADGVVKNDKGEKANKAGQWDPRTGKWVDFDKVARSLWSFGRVAARRLRDTYHRLQAHETRLQAHDVRLKALEDFQHQIEAKVAEGEKLAIALQKEMEAAGETAAASAIAGLTGQGTAAAPGDAKKPPPLSVVADDKPAAATGGAKPPAPKK